MSDKRTEPKEIKNLTSELISQPAERGEEGSDEK